MPGADCAKIGGERRRGSHDMSAMGTAAAFLQSAFNNIGTNIVFVLLWGANTHRHHLRQDLTMQNERTEANRRMIQRRIEERRIFGRELTRAERDLRMGPRRDGERREGVSRDEEIQRARETMH